MTLVHYGRYVEVFLVQPVPPLFSLMDLQNAAQHLPCTRLIAQRAMNDAGSVSNTRFSRFFDTNDDHDYDHHHAERV